MPAADGGGTYRSPGQWPRYDPGGLASPYVLMSDVPEDALTKNGIEAIQLVFIATPAVIMQAQVPYLAEWSLNRSSCKAQKGFFVGVREAKSVGGAR